MPSARFVAQVAAWQRWLESTFYTQRSCTNSRAPNGSLSVGCHFSCKWAHFTNLIITGITSLRATFAAGFLSQGQCSEGQVTNLLALTGIMSTKYHKSVSYGVCSHPGLV